MDVARLLFVFFFFQAEDGIRDYKVTGVQTCALPISLVAHQLKRLARRVSLGLGRNGSISGNGSGDIFIAFSTANSGAAADHVVDLKMLPNDHLEPVFAATVQATERSEEHTSELQSPCNLVCRLLLEKKKA